MGDNILGPRIFFSLVFLSLVDLLIVEADELGEHHDLLPSPVMIQYNTILYHIPNYRVDSFIDFSLV